MPTDAILLFYSLALILGNRERIGDESFISYRHFSYSIGCELIDIILGAI